MSERFPGYDVLAKRDSVSWNEQTRAVIDARLAMDPEHHQFLDDGEWRTLKAICDRIVPQPIERQPQAPVAALVDQKLAENEGDGYRRAEMPPLREAWRKGLAALNQEALEQHGTDFAHLDGKTQDTLLQRVQRGDVRSGAWAHLPPILFFRTRLQADIVAAYYAMPCAWSEIGFGGPASPRGYVRMSYDRRDPWEAAEARPGREEAARRENASIG